MKKPKVFLFLLIIPFCPSIAVDTGSDELYGEYPQGYIVINE